MIYRGVRKAVYKLVIFCFSHYTPRYNIKGALINQERDGS